MASKYMEKRGQIALWVILALAIAGIVLLFFTFGRSIISSKGTQFNPQQAVELCIKDIVNEAVDKMLPQGGFLEPEHYKLYNETKMTYLCEIPEDFEPCINLHPMLLTEIREEIKKYVEPKIESCFEPMEKQAREKKIDITLGALEWGIALAPKKIIMNVTRETKITEKEETRTIDDYSLEIPNPVYDMALVAANIVDSESTSCNFDYVSYMLMNKNIDIKRNMLSEYTKLYTLEDRDSGKIMNFAIRGCAIPVGLPIT
jgi:hypothetical protein